MKRALVLMAAAILAGGLAGVELPKDFRALDFIRSTGTQYIDTGYLTAPNDEVRCVVSVDVEQVKTSRFACIFGTKMNNDRDAFAFFTHFDSPIGKRSSYNRGLNREQTVGTGFPYGEKTTLVCQGLTARWTGVSGRQGAITTSGALTRGQNTLYVFQENTGAANGSHLTLSSWITMNLYAFTITGADGVQRRDFVPCRNAKGVLGLFDRVEGKFYANAGTGEFLGSDDALLQLSIPVLPSSARLLSYNTVRAAIERADKACDAAWTACRTKDEVRARGAQMRTAMRAAIGGFPTTRCPLNAQTVAKIPRVGYTVEKVMFESWPGLHVTANLFLPNDPKFKPPYPAVIVPCGHSQNGKGSVAYQRGCVLAAQAGLACLIYDPLYQGERYQDRGSDKNPCHGHNRIGALANLLGQNTARYRIWDGMRAIDYLQTRPEVDGARIGCMGQSGGGTMTSLLMALEPRLMAACPAGYLSNCREVYDSVGPGDAEQNVFGQFTFGLNHASYILMQAPLAVRLECNHQDYFPFSGSCKTMNVVTELVQRLGWGDRYGMTSAEGSHGWNEALRVSSVEWLARWLKGDPSQLRHDLAGYQALVKNFNEKAMDDGLATVGDRVTPTGRVLDLPGERTIYDVLRDELASARAARKGTPTPEIVARTARITLPGVEKVVRREVERSESNGLTVLRETYTWPNGLIVPTVTFVPRKPVAPPVLVVGDGQRSARGVLVEKQLAEGRPVLVPDLIGTGEIGWRRHEYYARSEWVEGLSVLLYTLGKTLAGEQAGEILEIAQDAQARFGGACKVVATGRTAIAAAHAAAVRRDLVNAVTPVEAPPAWTTSVKEAYYIPFCDTVFGALKQYDWVDLLPPASDRLTKKTFEHVVTDEVSLAGTWEMAYRPDPWPTGDLPTFTGVTIPQAVPGFWEDQVAAFRAAGMTDEFRINPLHVVQKHPIGGYACDLTLPNIWGCFLYRRTFTLNQTGPAVLAFTTVRNQVQAWINGQFIAFRQGFSTPFELAIPDGVLKKGTNEIVLAVANTPNLGYGLDWVSGMTTRSVFRSTGGIDGPLSVRFVKNALADVYVTTATDLKTFTVHATGNVPFTWEIKDGLQTVARGETTGDFTCATAGYTFWSPENPKRYELVLTTAEGVYRQKFGLRRLVAVGEKLQLNGQPIYLRGLTEHCYFPKTVHLPHDLDFYRSITKIRKELGFNFIRFHTYIPVEEYFEATDELGMLIHIETPNFVDEDEFASIIAFARRHPSVVIYCTGNETRIDRIAETYLQHVAEMVHTGTDSLFSPMSALRGVEYALMKGKDDIVSKPFPHNPKRMARMLPYCDLFNSYQLGLTSYDSLNSAGPQTLDAWGDVYGGKPRLSHEISIDGTYIDFSAEALYPTNSPILKTGLFSGLRRHLTERGLMDRVPTYFRNSNEWMRRIRKFTFEKVRAADRVAGYDFLGDINTHGHTFGYHVGMLDEFYRLKPGETVANVRRYNSAAVLLCDLGSDFNMVAGEPKTVSFSLSNYDRTVADATLELELVRADTQFCVARRKGACGPCANGQLRTLGNWTIPVPATKEPVAYLLRARVGTLAANEWEVYAFPQVASTNAPQNVKVWTDCTKGDLVAALAKGERVVLFGTGPFKARGTSFRSALAGRSSGNLATVVKAGHPALAGLPHDGFCGWQFRRLLEGGRAIQLEAGVPFDPIVDVASCAKFPIRQGALFEYQVGAGRLLVCGLNFKGKDPAQAWLRNRLVAYAASDAFRPSQSLTSDQLVKLIDAPRLEGKPNANLARNPNDPSSGVRAGAKALP